MKYSVNYRRSEYMSPKRLLPLAAIVGLGIGLIGPILPASAVVPQTTCWTVFRATSTFSTAGGTTKTGSAHVGDTFENFNSQVKGSWRFGMDDETGATGWIADGDLTHGVPCG
jgi:hypothetical protein